MIVLNNVDLVDEAGLDSLEVKIRDIKEGARILRTTNSQLPLPLILSVGLFKSDKYFDQEEAHTHEHHNHHHEHDHSESNHENHDHHEEHHHHEHSHHLENDGFTSISFESDTPLSIRKFQYFLDNRLPENIFRAKGIIWFDESPKRHISHLCGKLFTLDHDECKGDKKNQLVLICKKLHHDHLFEQLENCVCLPSVNRG